MRLAPVLALLACLILQQPFQQSLSAQQAQPPAQQNGPKAIPGPISAEPAIADFGIVEPGTVVSKTIKLINPLDRPVLIRLARPSCTCTTVDMTGKTIPAKGSIEMPMSMKTSLSVGRKTAQVNMVFEGLEQLLEIKLVAETSYAVRANPAYIDALAPERMKGFFELLSNDGTPFMVKTVDGRPAESADGSPMKPATRQVVRYDLTKPGLQNSVPPFLIVETDHPRCPALDLRVRHDTTKISPVLNFAEFRTNVGVIQNGTPTEFEIELKHAGALRVDRVASRRTEIAAALVEQKSDGDALLVKVRLMPVGMPAGPFLFTCTFGSGAKTSDLWIYGVAR